MVKARLFNQTTRHEMGPISAERSVDMSMNTHGTNRGYSIVAEGPYAAGVLRLGQEYHRERLDDWWPAMSGSMMMGPDDFRSIDGGQRDRLALYGEWEGQIDSTWSVNAGLRGESVRRPRVEPPSENGRDRRETAAASC